MSDQRLQDVCHGPGSLAPHLERARSNDSRSLA